MENTKVLALVIILGVVVILLLISLVAANFLWIKRKLLEKENKLREVENLKQIELIKAIVDTEEKQKTNIARDIHDQIITELTLKALILKTHIDQIEKGNRDFDAARQGVQDLAGLADSIRKIVHGIVPDSFRSFGLVKSIETLVSEVNNVNSFTAIFNKIPEHDVNIGLPTLKQLTLYRASAEILRNVIKHAKCNYLEVTLEFFPEKLSLEFAHDGKGITNRDIDKLTGEDGGIGLKSIQSRIVSLSGKIDYAMEEGVSFIKLIVPTTHDDEVNN